MSKKKDLDLSAAVDRLVGKPPGWRPGSSKRHSLLVEAAQKFGHKLWGEPR